MPSRTEAVALAAAVIALSSCVSKTRDQKAWYVTGSSPELASGLSLWTDLNTVVATNRFSQAADQFSLAPPGHVRSVPLARFERDQTVLPSSDGSYFVAASGYGYAVLKPGGAATVDPLPRPR